MGIAKFTKPLFALSFLILLAAPSRSADLLGSAPKPAPAPSSSDLLTPPADWFDHAAPKPAPFPYSSDPNAPGTWYDPATPHPAVWYLSQVDEAICVPLTEIGADFVHHPKITSPPVFKIPEDYVRRMQSLGLTVTRDDGLLKIPGSRVYRTVFPGKDKDSFYIFFDSLSTCTLATSK